MALVAEPGPGIWYPGWISPVLSYNSGLAFRTAQTLNAASMKISMFGSVFIDGRATGKTISSAGGKIHFLPGTVTFANAGTAIRVGLQDVATGAGPATQPDGTFDVYGDLVGATDTITSNTTKTVTMGTGTKTLSNGDLVCIVLDMTSRGGSDSVIVRGIEGASLSTSPNNIPSASTHNGTVWASTTASVTPIAVIEFDDGVFGVLNGTWPISNLTAHTFVSTDTPDEKGLIFQVPTERKIDAFSGMIYMAANAAADFTFLLYSDPLGTPSPVSGGSLTVIGENGPGSAMRFFTQNLAAEVTLAANTDYALMVKADSSQAVGFQSLDVANATYRKFFTGSTNLRMGHRTNGTGAFTETTTQIPMLSVRCSAFHDGTGGGGGDPVPGTTFTQGIQIL